MIKKLKRLAAAAAVLLAAAGCTPKAGSQEAARLLGECTELGTVEYTCDIRFQNEPDKLEPLKVGPRVILYSAKAYIKAGIDLEDKERIKIESIGRSVTVTLPKPIILTCKVEPKDISKDFEKIGLFRSKFTNQEKLEICRKAEKDLRQQTEGDNPRIDILSEAEANARAELELLLKATGRYDNITVKFEGNEKEDH